MNIKYFIGGGGGEAGARVGGSARMKTCAGDCGQASRSVNSYMCKLVKKSSNVSGDDSMDRWISPGNFFISVVTPKLTIFVTRIKKSNQFPVMS